MERPEAEPGTAAERPRIVTAKKPKSKPNISPAARDNDGDEAALEQARAFLKRALRPPNEFASNPPNDPRKQSANDRPMKDDD